MCVTLNRYLKGRNLRVLEFQKTFQKEYASIIDSCRLHWVLYTSKFSQPFVKKLPVYHKISAFNSAIRESLSLLSTKILYCFGVVLAHFESFWDSLGFLLGCFGSFWVVLHQCRCPIASFWVLLGRFGLLLAVFDHFMSLFGSFWVV